MPEEGVQDAAEYGYKKRQPRFESDAIGEDGGAIVIFLQLSGGRSLTSANALLGTSSALLLAGGGTNPVTSPLHDVRH